LGERGSASSPRRRAGDCAGWSPIASGPTKVPELLGLTILIDVRIELA
jgi:hypothetical protein